VADTRAERGADERTSDGNQSFGIVPGQTETVHVVSAQDGDVERAGLIAPRSEETIEAPAGVGGEERGVRGGDHYGNDRPSDPRPGDEVEKSEQPYNDGVELQHTGDAPHVELPRVEHNGVVEQSGGEQDHNTSEQRCDLHAAVQREGETAPRQGYKRGKFKSTGCLVAPGAWSNHSGVTSWL
jgi:hypothetical protein